MRGPHRQAGGLFRCLKQRPWPRSTAIAPTLDKAHRVEEENTPYYSPTRFYPARLGEVLRGRYQVATKLGYGTSSTVWLARDLAQWRWLDERYVAVKINALDSPSSREAEQELKISETISAATAPGIGRPFLRTPLDSFTLRGLSGDHSCLVFEPLREPLWLVKTRFEGKVIPPEIFKIMVEMILHALDYLHRTCNIIHADLKLDNILMKLESEEILAASAVDEFHHPLPQKTCDDRVIYLSRNNFGPLTADTFSGIIRLCDFGYSVLGKGPHYGAIQVEEYRAPEVILDAGWSHSADIWNLGVMLWDVMEGRALFEPVDSLKYDYDEGLHLALISALLDLLQQIFLGKVEELTCSTTQRSLVRSLEGSEKQVFLGFVGEMLKWRLEERSTAAELLKHPWLRHEV